MMKEKLSIYPISEQDISGIVQVVNDAYEGAPGSRSWTSEGHLVHGSRTTPDNIRQLFNQASTTIFKCVTETGDIHGSVVLEKKPDTIYLGMLSVNPYVQASGIGSMLIEYSEAYAKEHGLHSVTITVIDKRTELIDWYLRKGFRYTGNKIPFNNQSSVSRLSIQLVELRKEL